MAASRSSEQAYHVFLSFNGDDTGKNFSDHLYAALKQSGIRTFRGDNEMGRREIVDVQVQMAMQGSKFCIVVFSKDYASSTLCLEELVKIMKLRETGGLIVVPVFYDADPNQVWEQSGSYAEAFARHEEMEKMEKVKQWREVLRSITDLSGNDLQQRHETEFIQEIIQKVQNRLNQLVLVHVPPYLVGIDSRVKDINLWLEDGSTDPAIAVIYGIGGVGKTTIAKTVYNLNLDRFQGSCFLANVREASKRPNGLILLQKQLVEKFLPGKKIKINSVDEGSIKVEVAISCKKVLLVFDDVDQLDQIQAIIGMDSLYQGSKIIITTRLKRLLNPHETYKKFRVKELDNNESLQLFSWHAFGQNRPIEDYLEHSESIVKQCCGIPLALEALGSYLSVKNADEWSDELKKLKAIPYSKVQKSLQISYDSLQDDQEKNLFLHIACFFIGKDKDYVVKILDGCEFYTEVGIQNLIDRHLVSINRDNKLMMHPLLRDMGREIIRQESPEHQGSRSRLWHHEDALTVLQENIGTEAIRGLTLNLNTNIQEQQHIISCLNCAERQYYEDLISKCRSKRHRLGVFSWKPAEVGLTPASPESNELVLETKAFAKMCKLKLLWLNYVRLNGGYEHFPKSLVWLCWHGFPLKSMPSDLCLENLVVLDMRHSNLKHAWNGTRVLVQLKILNLSHSYNLVSTPDLSGLPNLEILKLKCCINLVEVHKSIGNLKKLVLLNVKDCKRLRKLPRKIIMLRSLEKLILSGCSELDIMSSELRKMKSLKVLYVDSIVQHTTKLHHSTFWSWLSQRQGMEFSVILTSLPGSLEQLSLADCNLSEDALGLCCLSSLHYLNLSGNSISCLPETINSLTKLESLVLNNCRSLQSLSELPTTLRELSAEKCTSLQKITNLPNLMRSLMLNLAGCEQLVEVQGLFKLELINNCDMEMVKKLGLFNLGPVETIKIEMFSVMTMTSRISKPQVLHECGICSIFIPGSEVPGWYSSQNEGPLISFSMPSPHSRKICGFNICAVYTCSDERNGLHDPHYIKVWNKTKELKWTYSPTFYGIPETEESMLWLSHWKLGDQLEGGNQLNVSVALSTGYQAKSVGIHIVYEQEKDNIEPNSDEAEENTSYWHRICNNADLEMYRIGREAFFLCNHDYLIHQDISEGSCENLSQYSHLFEQ